MILMIGWTESNPGGDQPGPSWGKMGFYRAENHVAARASRTPFGGSLFEMSKLFTRWKVPILAS
jgi:hypothetical protein